MNAVYRVARNEYNLQHSWTWIHGRHQLDFGLDITRDQSILDQDFNSDGTWTFAGRLTGDNLADFMYGKASAFAQISPLYNNLIRNLYGAYIQDNFKTQPARQPEPGPAVEPVRAVYRRPGTSDFRIRPGLLRGREALAAIPQHASRRVFRRRSGCTGDGCAFHLRRSSIRAWASPGGDVSNADHPSWGALKGVTKAVVGNHEYGTSDADGYYAYFCDRQPARPATTGRQPADGASTS